MTLPKTLISTAALGTAQHEPEALDPDTPLAALVAQLDPSDRAARLLAAAAALTLQQQAGWLPPHDHRPLPTACPPDSAPLCGPRAIRQLMIMLDGHYADVLHEWLAEVANAGLRAPEEALPLLLNAGRKRPDLREPIAPVLGNRGRWLAAQGKDQHWQWASTFNIGKHWDGWTTETRVMALESLRRADPVAARQIVIDQWEPQDWKACVELLKCFCVRLSMADEPFLESLLESGSPEVRHAAADLLGNLPNSRLSQRMCERAIPYTGLTKVGLRRQLAITLMPPDTITTEMLHDVGALGGTSENSVGGQWLECVLRVVQPTFWLSHWNISYDELFEAAANSKQSALLYNAWAMAAQRISDFEFIERLALDLLRRYDKGFRDNHPALSILNEYTQPWSAELTRALLVSLQQALTNGVARTRLPIILLKLSLYVPVDMANEIVETLREKTTSEKSWPVLVDEIRLLLDFRRDVLSAIRNKE